MISTRIAAALSTVIVTSGVVMLAAGVVMRITGIVILGLICTAVGYETLDFATRGRKT